MSQVNPITTTPEEQFVVGESDFAFFDNYACRIEGGAFLFCRSGSAQASVNQYQGEVRRNTMVLLLPGSILLLTDRTEDFRVTFCAFSRDLFAEAAFRLDPSFFRTLGERPISYPPARVVEGAAIWFQMAAYTYRDRNNVFRNTIIKNRLQNVLLESYDKMQRFAARQPRTPEVTTRQTDLFQRFVALVHEYCSQEREVAFYADKLCISTRYLSTIVRSVARSSAKEFIDRAVILEIKMMLQSTDLSVQEIAYRLRFSDQSYLGRFFKKHTGESPTEYRNMRK
ncbi:helix-turn-helix domain-containing protein [Alistipes intestinihominis]|uniref:Helix-turn-helix domain-containing protein n=1 Tax=Alistipes intestinihominis TaxID=3133172 RepID=A0ABV1GZC3_9BACT